VIAPDGDETQKIELLADGQQVVGFGIHEDTNKPYEWFGGEPGVIRRGELPAINQTEAQQLVDDAVELLVLEHGYQRAKDRPKKNRAPTEPTIAGVRQVTTLPMIGVT